VWWKRALKSGEHEQVVMKINLVPLDLQACEQVFIGAT